MELIRFDGSRKKVELERIPTGPGKLKRKRGEQRFAALADELFELQDLMFGARTHALLVVLQGRDTAGKDGTIKHVVGCLNPRGVGVASFGVPSEQELAHDFLWRIHRHTPARGEVAIFNRSHYEDVLVVRVHDLAPKATWRRRFDQINAFEQTLVESGTIVLKFFLHISLAEQERRLLAREEEPRKAWKLNVNDWRERGLWDDYTVANQEAIRRCATKRAPWFVVPADKKWYRNLVVAEAICDALRPYRRRWQKTLDQLGRERRAEIVSYRAEEKRSRRKGRG
jgi:PPK2 family polyphosphate:nucleotide phosphotransferase